MRRLYLILILAAALQLSAAAQGVFVEKGNCQVGLSAAYLSADSDNSEFFLLINPANARASATLISPSFEYAYSRNKGFGLRMQSLRGNVAVDDLTLDLLNDGLSFTLDDASLNVRSLGASIFRRAYYRLDEKGRLGAFTEIALGYSSGTTRAAMGSPADSYARNMGIKLSFSPGLMFFVMNQVSAAVSVSIANVSYNKVDSYKDGQLIGSRDKFGARCGVDLLGLNFGVTLHL